MSIVQLCLTFFMKTTIGIVGAGSKTDLLEHGAVYLIVYSILGFKACYWMKLVDPCYHFRFMKVLFPLGVWCCGAFCLTSSIHLVAPKHEIWILVGTFVPFAAAVCVYMYCAEMRYSTTILDLQRISTDHRTDMISDYKERLGKLIDSGVELTSLLVYGAGTAARLFDDKTYIQKVLLICNTIGIIAFGGGKLIDKANKKHFRVLKYFFGVGTWALTAFIVAAVINLVTPHAELWIAGTTLPYGIAVVGYLRYLETAKYHLDTDLLID